MSQTKNYITTCIDLALHQVLPELMSQENGNTQQLISLEHPAAAQFGEYSTNVAMILFSKYGKSVLQGSFKSPRALAERIALEILQHDPDKVFAQVNVAGPGFINFHLSSTFFYKVLEDLLKQLEGNNAHHIQPISEVGQGKKVVVEYSSPNIAKPFTVGHLRSTIIGDAVANILEATGWQVYRDNHLGDWGTQFGKQIYAIKTWGSEEAIENSTEPVKQLVELYVKFHEEAEKNPEIEDEGRKWFKKLEDGDPEARRLWQRCIEWSFKEFDRIYQKLSIHFTENNGRGYGESFFEDKMSEVIAELEEKDLLKESEGARLVFFPDDKYPPLMIMKKDGATLYATRDLATDKFRLQHYGKDIRVINEVGGEQTEYFRQLYAVEEMLGWYAAGQRVHVKHGLYRFKDKKMSTRKGNVIWLADVLEEATARAAEVAQAVGKQSESSVVAETVHAHEVVGIGALKWNDLKRSSHLDVVFDWDEILSMDGNSGPYVQYAYARCKSLLRKAQEATASASVELQKQQFGVAAVPNINEEEKAIFRLLYQFTEVVERAAEELSPHHLCTYLFELAQVFNTFYNKHKILDSEQRGMRLQLVRATASILERGLGLLGIQTLEQM